MTPIGWIIMTVSITSVVTLVVFCYYRVLTGSPDKSKSEAGFEFHSRDERH